MIAEGAAARGCGQTGNDPIEVGGTRVVPDRIAIRDRRSSVTEQCRRQRTHRHRVRRVDRHAEQHRQRLFGSTRLAQGQGEGGADLAVLGLHPSDLFERGLAEHHRPLTESEMGSRTGGRHRREGQIAECVGQCKRLLDALAGLGRTSEIGRQRRFCWPVAGGSCPP